jgi:hypothetical protein
MNAASESRVLIINKDWSCFEAVLRAERVERCSVEAVQPLVLLSGRRWCPVGGSSRLSRPCLQD